MAATVESFRERFPQFNGTAEDQVAFALAEAKAIHNIKSLATLFLTAHILTLDAQGGGGQNQSGEATMKRAGPVSASYITQAERGGEAFFTSTGYGKRYLNLAKHTPRAGIGAVIAP